MIAAVWAGGLFKQMLKSAQLKFGAVCHRDELRDAIPAGFPRPFFFVFIAPTSLNVGESEQAGSVQTHSGACDEWC